MRPDPYAWTLHPEALVAVAAVVVAAVAALRPARPARWRLASFAAGVALLLVALVSPLEALSFHLLTAHLLQNVVLAEWAPALLVLAVPPAVAVRVGRVGVVRALTRPLVALPLWLLVYFLWHLPPAYDTALRHPDSLLHVEHACYLVAGTVFWWPVFQDEPHAFADGARGLYVFAAFVLASPIGLLLALLPEPIYDFYDGSGLWGLSALEDQQIAGVTMASEQSVVFFAVFAFFLLRFMRAEEAAA